MLFKLETKQAEKILQPRERELELLHKNLGRNKLLVFHPEVEKAIEEEDLKKL